MRSVRHGCGRSALGGAGLIDITSSTERAVMISRNRQHEGQRLFSAAHSSLFRTRRGGKTQIVEPMNLPGGALVGEQGRASRFAP
jgi:hypothetical protein